MLTLQAQLRDLMDRLKPPEAGSPMPRTPGPDKTPIGKPRSGQNGHPPHLKKWLSRRGSRLTAHSRRFKITQRPRSYVRVFQMQFR